MTGFGSSEAGGFRVEIRSLNHRFMEVYMKYPPALSRHEIPLREILKNKFGRGKFDVYISYLSEGGLKSRINRTKVKEVYDALADIKNELSIKGEISMDALLEWKEHFIEEETSFDTEAMYSAFKKAAEGLEEMRLREGGALASEISAIIGELEALNNGIIAMSKDIMDAAKEKYCGKLRELLADRGCDDSKLIQEASALAEKADITEELTRIKGHLEHMAKILSNGGTIGRKLDFLLQELHREANTVSSKCDDYRALKSMIQMKAEIEKVKEQVQNIQ